jgi:glycosyltransferase involved in cell wall biosynthesis
MMNENPRISVITVVYNAQKTIEQTMLSVLNQTNKNIEYIIVDGVSTDGTLDIIKNYELKIKSGEFSNISFRYISEPDKGIYDAMNKGIDLATGEWINFMNSGDRFYDSEVLQNVFNQNFPPEVKFLYSDFIIEKSEKYKVRVNATFDEGTILHQSVIYKRELHNKWGLYVVTPKIIISDYLFFNAIPKEQACKIDTVISINSASGISSGDWCALQKSALDYVFNRISFMGIFRKAIAFKMRKWIKRIVGKNLIFSVQVLAKSKPYRKK